MTVSEIKEKLEPLNNRGAWNRGVKEYAIELLDGLEEGLEHGYLEDNIFQSRELLNKAMLNGASNWHEYSYGGCSLIYNGDICERLCPPSTQIKCDNGRWNPNKNENWLDVQARALYQAASLIRAVVF